MESLSPVERRLLNDYQRQFPLVARPYAAIAGQLGLSEDNVMERLRSLRERGVISRIGPVFSPGAIGSSLLAALAVPADRLESVAAWISALPEVNHNYEREHAFNLWFVVAASDEARVQAVLQSIRDQTGCALLALPLLEQYHIDLGFDLFSGTDGARARRARPESVRNVRLDAWQSGLVAGLQGGLPIESEPYAVLAARLAGVACPDDETASSGPDAQVARVTGQISDWCVSGVIRRFGVVVRHHELGYRDNAMVVWDVPDEMVARYGALAAGQDAVTLCYRRPRRLPAWPFNLFCMIHGKDRDSVRAAITDIGRQTGLSSFDSRVLFSTRRFKQCGARYVST